MTIATDKKLHMITSCLLTLGCSLVTKSAIPVIALGATVEMLDYKECKDSKECLGDMAANIAGVLLGLLILKTLKK